MANIDIKSLARDMSSVIRYEQEMPDDVDMTIGCEKIARIWKSQNWYIQNLFEKDSHYNGNFQLVFPNADMSRRVCGEASARFFENIMHHRRVHLRMADFDEEYMMRRFESALYNCIRNCNDQYISADDEREINKYEVLNLKAHKGAKFTRLVARYAKTTGVDQWEGFFKQDGYAYNFQEMAKYVSPYEAKGTAILSWHPIDYLLMSNGTDWISCHGIGHDENRKGGFGLCHQSGTLSYMMDGHTLILYYLRDYEGDHPEYEFKANRQCIHLDYLDGLFVQSRMYPDGRDLGDTGMRSNARNLLLPFFSDIFHTEYKDGVDGAEYANRVCKEADCYTHYPDYSEIGDVTTFVPKNSSLYGRAKMILGHSAICPVCGKSHGRPEMLTCYSCYDDVFCS